VLSARCSHDWFLRGGSRPISERPSSSAISSGAIRTIVSKGKTGAASLSPGKAHTHARRRQAVHVRRSSILRHRLDLFGKVVFIEDYDHQCCTSPLSRAPISGSTRPSSQWKRVAQRHEDCHYTAACHLSTMDGWWREAIRMSTTAGRWGRIPTAQHRTNAGMISTLLPSARCFEQGNHCALLSEGEGWHTPASGCAGSALDGNIDPRV